MYAVLCLIVFVNGAMLGLAAGYFLWKRPKPVKAEEPRPVEDEIERARKEREELELIRAGKNQYENPGVGVLRER